MSYSLVLEGGNRGGSLGSNPSLMADTVALILWGDGNTGSSDYTDIGQTEKSQALRGVFH